MIIFGKILYFIYFYTQFPVFYFIKQLYSEKMLALLNAVHNYLVRKLCFKDRPRCRAVFLSFWNFPCLNPAEKYAVFCKHHSQRRTVDHKAYHLIGKYYDERSYAQHCALNGINSERMFEFNRSHDLGRNESFYAALEHHLRIVYQLRFGFDYCPDHANFEESLQDIYRNYYDVDLNRVRRMVPLEHIYDDRQPFADYLWSKCEPSTDPLDFTDDEDEFHSASSSVAAEEVGDNIEIFTGTNQVAPDLPDAECWD